MVFFNLIGLGWLIAAFVSASLVNSWLPDTQGTARLFFLIGGFLFALDGGWRYFRVRPKLAEAFAACKSERGLMKTPPVLIWFLSNHGGNLMLMPAWAFALLIILIFGTGII